MHNVMTRREFISQAALALSTTIFCATSVAHADEQMAIFPENYGLTESEINQRFIEMSHIYQDGDQLSAVDYEFVQLYALSSTARATQEIYGSRYYNGATYEIMGNAYQNGFGDYTAGATIQAGSSQSSSRNISIYFGYMGFNLDTVVHEYGRTYSGANRNWFVAEYQTSYTGFTTSYRFYYSATITTADGNVIVVS